MPSAENVKNQKYQQQRQLTRTELMSRAYSSAVFVIVTRSCCACSASRSCALRSTSASAKRECESDGPRSEEARSEIVCTKSPIATESSIYTLARRQSTRDMEA